MTDTGKNTKIHSKNILQRKVELLAPAGNYDTFEAVLKAGADAVYLGGTKYSARAFADNFSDEEILKAIEVAHLQGKKVYMTVNTLLKEPEYRDLIAYMTPFCDAGLDGIIIQDIGAFLELHKCFPNTEMHVSTQMTVTGEHSAKMLKDLGAVRIVPARELTLNEIKEIKEHTGLEIECFIHGAMCYSYSGQCLMSSLIGGRSGNRGRCAQPCRLPYKVKCGNSVSGEQYPLSMKDMCTVSLIPKLIEAGIDSFKIEGRMKKAEYSAGVTAIYRKYIDLYYETGLTELKIDKEDMKRLSTLYIRSEIQNGYYEKRNDRSMITLISPAYCPVPDELIESIHNEYAKKKLQRPIHMTGVFIVGEPAYLMVQDDLSGICIYMDGDTVQKAQNRPMGIDDIKRNLLKLGNTCFECSEDCLDITVKGELFYPIKNLNELRRTACDMLLKELKIHLEEQRIAALPKSVVKVDSEYLIQQSSNEKGLHAKKRVLIRTGKQLNAVMESSFEPDLLYLELSLIASLEEDRIAQIKDRLPKCKLYAALPNLVRQADLSKIKADLEKVCYRLDGALAKTPEAFAFLKSQFPDLPVALDAGIYNFNARTWDFWRKRSVSVCVPYELNHGEIRSLFGSKEDSVEQVVYGYQPMMITANCIAKTCGKCPGNGYKLIDRYGKVFTTVQECRYCSNTVFNSLPLSLHNALADGKVPYDIRIQFSFEDEAETKAVLSFYGDILDGIKRKPPFEEYTKGHDARGVE